MSLRRFAARMHVWRRHNALASVVEACPGDPDRAPGLARMPDMQVQTV